MPFLNPADHPVCDSSISLDTDKPNFAPSVGGVGIRDFIILRAVSVPRLCALILLIWRIWSESWKRREVYVHRRGMLQLLAGAAIGGGKDLFASSSDGKGQASQDYVAWVAEVLKRMQTVKPGMTRETLYRVFTTEGGLDQVLRRRFVSRDCPYFKVDVEFQAVRLPERDGSGRATLAEDGKDIILKISRPYLEFSIVD